jgi:hypothetical protein
VIGSSGEIPGVMNLAEALRPALFFGGQPVWTVTSQRRLSCVYSPGQMLEKTRIATLLPLLVLAQACRVHHPLPDHPPDYTVEIAASEPDSSSYELAGEIEGRGSAADVAQATHLAREDFRQQATIFHASVAVIDTNDVHNPYLGDGRGPNPRRHSDDGQVKVVLTGRAFRPKGSPP